MKKYVYGFGLALISVSLCNGMTWQEGERNREKARVDREAFIARFDDSQEFKNFEDYAHSLGGWRSQWERERREMQQAIDAARLVQTRLQCYPECANAQFIDKDEAWNPLRDTMDELVAKITDEEVKEIKAIEQKLEKKNFTAVTDADIACMIATTRKYKAITKASRAIEDKLKVAVLATATMNKMIEKKEKKCIVM